MPDSDDVIDFAEVGNLRSGFFRVVKALTAHFRFGGILKGPCTWRLGGVF
jgi:hypothetical protein